MKRTIIIEVFLFIVFAITIYFNFVFWNSIRDTKNLIDLYSQITSYDYTTIIEEFKKSIHTYTIYGSLTIISSVFILLTIILIAVKDFPVFKPITDKIKVKLDKNKATRAEQKALKAEAQKQTQIERLEKKLEELKKN